MKCSAASVEVFDTVVALRAPRTAQVPHLDFVVSKWGISSEVPSMSGSRWASTSGR